MLLACPRAKTWVWPWVSKVFCSAKQTPCHRLILSGTETTEGTTFARRRAEVSVPMRGIGKEIIFMRRCQGGVISPLFVLFSFMSYNVAHIQFCPRIFFFGRKLKMFKNTQMSCAGRGDKKRRDDLKPSILLTPPESSIALTVLRLKTVELFQSWLFSTSRRATMATTLVLPWTSLAARTQALYCLVSIQS